MMARIETAAAYVLFGLGVTMLLASNLVVPQNAFADSGCGGPDCDTFCDPSLGGDPTSSFCQSCLATLSCCNTDTTCEKTKTDCYSQIAPKCGGSTTCNNFTGDPCGMRKTTDVGGCPKTFLQCNADAVACADCLCGELLTGQIGTACSCQLKAVLK
jgi:hypothetical protein